MRVAIVNSGSSTVKTALAAVDAGSVRILGRWDRDGQGALEAAVRSLRETAGEVAAVGHRFVHGGPDFTGPVVVDPDVEAELDALTPLAPLHQPPALAGLRAARAAFPEASMVAVFDTAFHAGRPASSLRYAIPTDLAEAGSLRRYGFHGIAHESLVASLAHELGRPVSEVSAVTLQLGAGCSACAVRDGRSVETSMGFTPLEGLVMSTRSGDVDPGLVLHLVRGGRSVAEVEELLGRRSGLLGLAGTGDMREVLASAAAGSARAELALAMFVRRIVMTVGAYLTLLEGEGAIVFGGGIGARSPEVRRRVAAGLAAWNVRLDPEKNKAGPPGRISASEARPVFAFETDEETRIALAVARTLEERE